MRKLFLFLALGFGLSLATTMQTTAQNTVLNGNFEKSKCQKLANKEYQRAKEAGYSDEDARAKAKKAKKRCENLKAQ